MLNVNYILVPVISYLIGSIPFALWIVQLFFKKDLREGGSKNTGALNTLRIVSAEKGKVMGIMFFLLAFTLDALKAILAVVLAVIFLPQHPVMALTLGTFFVVLGHNYSILLNFKGGRGAAFLMGILLFLNWKVFFVWLAIVLFFMILFEIIMGGRVSKRFFKNAVSEQIIGRLFGEASAVYWIYFYDFRLFYPVLFATILIIIAHKDRVIDQIKKMNNKTYLNGQ